MSPTERRNSRKRWRESRELSDRANFARALPGAEPEKIGVFALSETKVRNLERRVSRAREQVCSCA